MKKKMIFLKNKLLALIKKSKKKQLIFYLIIILLIIPSSYFLFTFSRYVITNVYNNYLLSKEFYFYSNSLNGAVNNLYDWNGEDNYTLIIDVRNYIDELRWTKDSITYQVNSNCHPSISGNVTCTSNDGTINYSATGGTSNHINITLANTNNLVFDEDDYVDIDVNITSTSPYRKSLTATFRVYVVLQKIKYTITDQVNQLYFDLYISNYDDTANDVNLTWDYTKVRIDNTSSYILNGTPRTTTVDNITYVNGTLINLGARKSAIIRFYKNDATKNYTFPLGNNPSIVTIG